LELVKIFRFIEGPRRAREILKAPRDDGKEIRIGPFGPCGLSKHSACARNL
jgi:hypothetical protein